MVSNKSISVEVCYANVQHQELISLKLPSSATVLTAIKQSGILQKFKEIDLESNDVGIYGQIVKLDQLLRDNDRIEIYRPLRVNPMEARRLRAEQQKK